MAEVTLHTLWLNDTADLSDFQSFPYMAKLTAKPTVTGDVRTYVNGRRRAVTQPGRFTGLSVSLSACTREQVQWLEEHTGQLLLVRDDRGRKLYGIYFDHDVDEHRYDDEAEVTVSFTEVTHDEAV